jgi:hypothetical protein
MWRWVENLFTAKPQRTQRFIIQKKGEKMEIEEIGKQIVDSSLKVHKALGPGLLESAY